MRSLPRPAWLGALPGVALAAACAFRPAPDWPHILAEVRARYPDVPQVDGADLEARGAAGDLLLLDARAPEEFAVSHLRGARSAPDEESALRVLADQPREREIIVYCSVGMRSSDLAQRLRARGFTHASNLEGGIFAWANQGRAVWRNEERVEEVHPYDARWGALLVPEHRADLHARPPGN